ncbi:hypothetical protein OIU84_018019 [Salix udensis]|uniref:Uncharacterized protein n=1 Tax=Salix udensis TaxID=889485 RepID=A0AAD6L5G4_9ROSI|nr:hypothetical protein OIU84_018019 [Salix udensis]
MAIITEEAEIQPQNGRESTEEPTSPSKDPKRKPKPKPMTHTKPQTQAQAQTQTRNNPFVFWFYFTVSVSFVTFLAIGLSSLYSNPDPKSFFLSLSTPLRQHYSKGRTIKVQLAQNQPSSEVFVLESGKFVDLLGSKGVHGVVFDLPGNGFSDKSMEASEERGNGVLERFKDAYALIKEKGIFWAFDNMVETGQIPYEEILSHYSDKRSIVKPIVLGSEETGLVLGQVIETLGLAPVHLVLHDSSLGMVANWVLKNSGSIRSVTLVDTGLRPALPLCLLEVPVVREVVLGINFVYEWLIRMYCSRGIGGLDVAANRMMLNGRDGRRSVVATGKKLNSSFDIAEWGGLDGIKGIPMQVVWCSSWSKEWSEEGRKVATALPQAKFVTHSGGRWPQENAADELAENIVKFVSSLPKSVRRAEEEPIPEHVQKMLDEAKDGHHHHHHHGHGGHGHHDGHAHAHAHAHAHGAGYMDAYGLGHGWGS